ncbi:MAG: hypothetical protein MUF81_16090, partial [Verrucomicrobia bacterium]|nr:hypothetical protein [Verrucomicrobiota bacterium]
VALLQSPILPAATPPYLENRKFRNLPVDKPHTRISRLANFPVIHVPVISSAGHDFHSFPLAGTRLLSRPT